MNKPLSEITKNFLSEKEDYKYSIKELIEILKEDGEAFEAEDYDESNSEMIAIIHHELINCKENGYFYLLEDKPVKLLETSEYSEIPAISSFDEKRIDIYEGYEGGVYLASRYYNEAPVLLEVFANFKELKYFLDEKIGECQRFNRHFDEDEHDVFFTYYLLNHAAYSDPDSPNLHLLVKEVSMDHFEALVCTYESLYSKVHDYNDFVQAKDFPLFIPDEFFKTLSEDELNIFKFALFCNVHDQNIFYTRACESCIDYIDDIKKNAFVPFGISDKQIDFIFQKLKMKPYYFISQLRASKKPSVFYFDLDEGFASYLKPEDEIILWRAGKKYRDYLGANFDHLRDMHADWY